jgi:uncharacterized membrane protein YhaH (DUF805 family)
MNRVQFGVAQFAGISVAEALIPSHALKTGILVLLVASVTLLFGFMGFIASKRLQDIGWPRQWAMLVAGPAALDVLLGFRHQHAAPMGSLSVMIAAILCAVTMAYATMTIILVLKAGQPSSHGSSSVQPVS